MEEESSSKRKLKSLLEEVGITPSIRDIGKDMMEFDIPIYENTFISGLTYAGFPITGKLPDSEMRKIVLDLSSLVLKISNRIIYYTLDHLQESLKSEKNNVAFAFIQRATISHICNHKLSSEGITTERHGKQCSVVDEYKTMPLTRSVYEHLAMFYYLFDFSDNSHQQEVIWKSWLLGSKKNLLKGSLSELKEKRIEAQKEIKDITESLRNNVLVRKCISNPKGQFECCLKSNSVFTIIEKNNQYVTKKLTYDKAWKYLYGERIDLSLTYNFLSFHSHPTYIGLSQFNSQESCIEFPLYDSCHFLSYLCSLFMKQFQIDKSILTESLTEREQGIYYLLSNENNQSIKVKI